MRRSERTDAGYTMAILIIIMTVMMTLAAASLPLWSKLIQRDNEEELISRGWQYAEAIRLFQKRFGRLPIKLDELIKSQPRCIRKLYKDPMTGKDFLPIYLHQPVVTPPPGGNGLGPSGPTGASGPSGPSGPGDDDTPTVPTLPIVGVHSGSTKLSSLVFFGQEHYDQWLFSVEMLKSGQGRSVQASTRWLGRPLQFVTPPGFQNGSPPIVRQSPTG